MEQDMMYIEVFDSEEVISVPIGPDHAADPEEVLECLKAEEAPLGLWLDFVKAYLAAGHTAYAEKMLRESTSPEVEQHFNSQEDKAIPARVQLLCAAAAFDTARGRAERDRGTRNETFARAAGLLVQARNLDFRDQMPYLGTAQLALAKGDVEGAKREYEKAVKLPAAGRPNIAPLLGLATLAYNQGNYTVALAMFRKALRQHPGAPVEVRLGLGAAAFKLGRLDAARAAFQRALQLAPRCVPGLAGLAVLAMHAPPSANRLAEALQLLCQAYDESPDSAVVLNLLAHHCLLRGDYDKVTALATSALQAADSERLRADAEALLARAAHAKNDLRAAFAHYRQALAVDGKQPVAQYGLAQMTLLQGQGEIPNAISLLESSLTAAPAWPDALTVLAGLYPAAPGKRSAAVAQFQEAAHNVSASGDIWFMLAELLAPTDPPGALKAYDKAIELHRRAARAKPLANGFASAAQDAAEAAPPPPPPGPPVRLLNNAAVLHLRYGDPLAALPLMEEAVEGAAGGPTAARLTVGFNLARMREASGNVQAAANEYKAMLENFPHYIDCQLRLAAIAARGGKRAEAVAHLSAILKQKPGNTDALAFMGQLHFEAREYSEAGEAWEQLVAARDSRDDAYARLGLANLVLASVPADSNKEDVKPKRRSRLTQALKMYRDVLAKHPGNVYAANGVGAVLAEQGKLAEAREIFTEVQEAAAAEGRLALPEVWANAGGAAMGVHDTAAAVQQFTTALRRFHHGHESRLLWWKARAYYDADDLDAARRWLQKALHLAPAQPMLRFNIAAVMQQSAVRALRKERGPGDIDKLEDYEAAAEALNTAANSFIHLRRLPPARSRLDMKKLDAHIEFCQTTLRKATAYVETAQRERAIADAKRKEQELRLQAAGAARIAEEKRKAAVEAAARREREARAAAAVAKLEGLKAAWKENQALQAAAAAGDSGAVGKKKKQDKADVEMDALFGESSGDEDYDPNAPEPQADAAAGAAATPGDDEERKYMSDGDAEHDALAEAGLLTDEDEGTDGGVKRKAKAKQAQAKKKRKSKGDGGGEGARKAAKSKAAPSPGGRLKRLRAAGDEASGTAAAAGLEDEDVAGLEGKDGSSGGPSAAAAASIEDMEDGDAAAAAPRARVAELFEDSDEEPAAMPTEDAPRDEAGDGAAADDLDALFGSDEES